MKNGCYPPRIGFYLTLAYFIKNDPIYREVYYIFVVWFLYKNGRLYMIIICKIILNHAKQVFPSLIRTGFKPAEINAILSYAETTLNF